MDVFIDLVLSKLKQSFNNPEYSDVRIVSKNNTFYAHKLILTTRSGVWSSMEKFADIDVLCWNQIQDDVAERILRWIYMGERILCEKDSRLFAESLFKAAQFLGLSDILEICESFYIFLDLKQESVPIKTESTEEHNDMKGMSESVPPKRKLESVLQKPKLSTRTKMSPCGFCDKCKSNDCGRCPPCKDKTKFGGPGKRNMKCVMRACGNLAKAQLIRKREATISNARKQLSQDSLHSKSLFIDK